MVQTLMLLVHIISKRFRPSHRDLRTANLLMDEHEVRITKIPFSFFNYYMPLSIYLNVRYSNIILYYS